MPRKLLSIEEQLHELQLLRRDYVLWKRKEKYLTTVFRRENRQLRADKIALLKYIKELEGFLRITQDEEIRVQLQRPK